LATASEHEVFIGRQAELKKIGAALDRAAAGKPQLVIVRGEAGTGKSALVNRLGRIVASRGVAFHRVQCQTPDEAATGSLAAGLVRSLVDLPRRCTPAEAAKAMIAAPGVSSPQQAALLGQLLGLDIMDAAMQSLSGQQRRTGAFMALNDLISERAAEDLLMLSASDLQWADDASLDWLTSFFERIAAGGERLRLLITCETRSDQRLRLSHMGAAVELTPVQLEPLPRDQAEELATALLGRRREQLQPLAATALSRVVDRSGGNPLFLMQLLASAQESGALPSTGPAARGGETAADQAGQEVGATAGGPAAELPDSVRAAAGARLDKLSGALLRLVQVGAVLGRRFDKELLAKLHGTGTQAQVAEGIRMGVLGEDDDGRLRFREAEFQEVVYERMPPSLRKLLHMRAGEAIEATPGGAAGGAGPALHALAHHFARAEDAPRAARYLAEAGDHARAAGESARARDCYHAALGWQARIPGPAQGAEIMLHLAIVLGDLGNVDEALGVLDRRAEVGSESPITLRARAELLRRRGDLDQAQAILEEALADVADPDERALLLGCKSDVLRLSGDFKGAIALAKEAAAALAAQGRKPATEGYLRSVLGICHHRLGQLGVARLEHASALKLRESAGDVAGCAISLNNIATIDVEQGRWEQAEAGYRRSLGIARRLGDRRSIITALENLGDLLLARGQEEEAESHFRESLRLAREIGSVGDEIINIANLATLRLARRDGPGALQEIEACWSLAELSAFAEYAPDILCIRGRAYHLTGDLTAARRYQVQARGLADRSGNARLVAVIDRCLAELDAAEGQEGEAMDRAKQSEAILRKAALPLELGRTLAVLARIAPGAEREGYRKEAAALFESLGARRDLGYLEACEAGAPGQPDRTPGPPPS